MTGPAYREMMADVKAETQQAATMLPPNATSDMQQSLNNLNGVGNGTPYQQTSETNVVKAYQALAAPMDKLITELVAKQADVLRQDLVKQPDLDEAPALYRPAVSNYFETMSKDYHPDTADTPPNP